MNRTEQAIWEREGQERIRQFHNDPTRQAIIEEIQTVYELAIYNMAVVKGSGIDFIYSEETNLMVEKLKKKLSDYEKQAFSDVLTFRQGII